MFITVFTTARHLSLSNQHAVILLFNTIGVAVLCNVVAQLIALRFWTGLHVDIGFVISVRPHGTTRLSLDRFLLHFIFEDFSKPCRKNSGLIKI